MAEKESFNGIGNAEYWFAVDQSCPRAQINIEVQKRVGIGEKDREKGDNYSD